MILEAFAVGRLQANCYVVGDERTREVIVIDPGDEAPALLAECARRDYRVGTVLLTHHHLDHSGATHELLAALPAARFLMHAPLDYPALAAQAASAATWYGHAVTPPRPPDRTVVDGDRVDAGAHAFMVRHTPGHTPGSVCLAGEGVVFTGDVLFRRSIGRFDFPGSDGRALLRSIRDRLLVLPDETVVYPGHGPATTIGEERRANPFLVRPHATLGFGPDDGAGGA